MPLNNCKNKARAVVKAGAYTTAGGFFGGLTGATTAIIAGAMIKKGTHLTVTEALKQTVMASTTGGAVLCAGVGLLEATPLALSRVYSRMLCGEGTAMGLFAPFIYMGKELLGSELGRLILSEAVTFSVKELPYAMVGSVGTMVLFSIAMCMIINIESCNTSFMKLVDFLEHCCAFADSNIEDNNDPEADLDDVVIRPV